MYHRNITKVSHLILCFLHTAWSLILEKAPHSLVNKCPFVGHQLPKPWAAREQALGYD